MPEFQCEPLAALVRQLVYAPPPRRRQQIDRAEALYGQIEPEHHYPLEWVTLQITSYRPEGEEEPVTLVGEAVRQDLLLLVEALSDSLDDSFDDYDPRPFDLDGLCARLRVSAKTIGRYRREGLFARRLRGRDGRRRLAFLPASVERFLDAHGGPVRQAARFSRMDDKTRHAIITRARRIASHVDTSPFAVARHLAGKYQRSTEAIRRLLIQHDRRDPRTAIFRAHTGPLTLEQQREIHRAYHRGESVSALARRYGKARDAVYRAINHRRAAALKQLDLRCIKSPTFDRPDAEPVILGGALSDVIKASDRGAEEQRPANRLGEEKVLEALPAYVRDIYEAPMLDQSTEQALFVRYNFLKYRARQRRQALDRHRPAAGALDRIETYLRRAVTVKEQLARSYLRLVVSVARRHSVSARAGDESLIDLVGEGNVVLLDAIETFDAGRGNRFSTYLSWALMRHFATRRRKSERAMARPAAEAMAEYWPVAMNPALAAGEQAEHTRHTLGRLLGELDDRERLVLTRHFGLAEGDAPSPEPRTLAEVGEELGISAERARQIEHAALDKLRRAARQDDA